MNSQTINENIEKIKLYYAEMPRSKKIKIGVVSGTIIFFAIVLTIFLNMNLSGYAVIFPNMESEEAAEVFALLSGMGAEPKMDDGQVIVLEEEYTIWMMNLSNMGYPKTTQTFGNDYFSQAGMTTTASEREYYQLMDLQIDIEKFLVKLDNISAAEVTLTVPVESEYIWDQATAEERATAGVVITSPLGVTMSPGQIMAAKNLVAASVPKMDPADVTIIDSDSGVELRGEVDASVINITQNLAYEQEIQRQLEDNVLRLFSPSYGVGGVTAVARVKINYDKILSEQKTYFPNPDGSEGFPNLTEGEYSQRTDGTVGGIVGEEDNTDTPAYQYDELVDGENMDYFRWSTAIDQSYLKEQIEGGGAELERATISVMVGEDEPLTEESRLELTSLISNATDIDPAFIAVSIIGVGPAEIIEPSMWESIPLFAYGIFALVLLLAIGAVFFIVASARKRKRLAELRAEELRLQEEQDAIEQYKRDLSGAAMAGLSAKDEAILTEVREFASSNPEITANLLRAWIREGD